MKNVLLLGSLWAAAVACGGTDWNRMETYEPETPLAANPKALAAGLRGRVAETVRITPENAAGAETSRVWRATAWRNERVSGQIVLWSGDGAGQVRCTAGMLAGPGGAQLPAGALRARFVRYVFADKRLAGDILDTAREVDIPAGGFRPVWLTATVPADAAPGLYRGTLTVTAAGGKSLAFGVELTVLAAALPAPKDWAFFLDLWQHPWAVARYHHVEPFSPAHYALLEPIYRELASAGQKVLTTTITELPWNHQNFDAYHTMVRHIKAPDGTWSFDYSLFDQYVAFGKSCGLGQQIHCYTLAPWGNRVYYTDAATGDLVALTAKPGTPEFEAFWGPFLSDFQKHLIAKGWADQTFIAMDEREMTEMKATSDCLAKHAPRLRIAMPGNRPPSQLRQIEIANYCQVLPNVDAPFLEEVKARRAKGLVTTFYVCCSPKRPNTYTASPTAEQVWLPCFAAAKGLDGFLRWAYTNWPRDPMRDSSFGDWTAGDTFFLYPGPRSSVRWEMLRDGIEEAEKIRLLRSRGLETAALRAALGEYDYAANIKLSEADFAALVARTRRAVEEAAAGWGVK